MRFLPRNGSIILALPDQSLTWDRSSIGLEKCAICHKRYVEGKSPDQVARETYHSLDAVDRYLGQFDRVRHCRRQGLSAQETAHILNCGVLLVETYLEIDNELKGKDA